MTIFKFWESLKRLSTSGRFQRVVQTTNIFHKVQDSSSSSKLLVCAIKFSKIFNAVLASLTKTHGAHVVLLYESKSFKLLLSVFWAIQSIISSSDNDQAVTSLSLHVRTSSKDIRYSNTAVLHSAGGEIKIFSTSAYCVEPMEDHSIHNSVS